MSRFIQIHALTPYPLSNPNRDDTGRPKSASYGGVPRLRISSQALKRAIRLSPIFQSELEGHLGDRTQRIGKVIAETLNGHDLDDARKREIAEAVAAVFGKLDAAEAKPKKGKAKKGEEGDDDEAARADIEKVRIRQLAFLSPDERLRAIDLAERAARGEKLPSTAELRKEILQTADGAADVAMFGRMLADAPAYNREAAVQLAHAFTTHRVVVENDYYTAVDDLKRPEEDSGSAFIGETGFGSGVFYLYGCIDRDLLEENLQGDAELASRAIGAFVSALSSATPSGKRSSFAHQTRASFLLIEKGDQQPRSLAASFLEGVEGKDLLGASVKRLDERSKALDRAYGACADERLSMDVVAGEGTVAELVAFASAD